LTEVGAESLQDSRLGQNKQHGLLPLLRQSIYGCLAGYEDVNDAEQLCVAPTMRHVVGGGADEYQDRQRNSILDGESAVPTGRSRAALLPLFVSTVGHGFLSDRLWVA
jgi:hypothetical protein